LAPVAARVVSQRGGGARRGSESERGTRPAVEPLWASREPVRRKAQVPSKRERRLRRLWHERADLAAGDFRGAGQDGRLGRPRLAEFRDVGAGLLDDDLEDFFAV